MSSSGSAVQPAPRALDAARMLQHHSNSRAECQLDPCSRGARRPTVVLLTVVAARAALSFRSVLGMSRQLPGASVVSSPVVLFVIDGQQETLAMCALALLGMGLMTITAGSVEEGFERACLTQPDVIVVNDTHQALRRLTRQLREDARTREASLVVMPRPEPGSKDDADGAYDRIVAPSCAPGVLAFEIVEELKARGQRAP
jgi:hypothetical protein